METLPAPPGLATGQTSPQGGSGGAALGGPKKLRPVVMRRICPRRSGPNWQESMRNRWYRGKQMTADAGRLMRPGTAVQGSTARATTDQYCQAGLNSRVSLGKAVPYEGLSRMKGNFHVRFLAGGGPVTARLHSAWETGPAGTKLDLTLNRGGKTFKTTAILRSSSLKRPKSKPENSEATRKDKRFR